MTLVVVQLADVEKGRSREAAAQEWVRNQRRISTNPDRRDFHRGLHGGVLQELVREMAGAWQRSR